MALWGPVGKDHLRYFTATFALIVACFSTQIILPAFNEDDIIQAQEDGPGGIGIFIAQGRWAYGILFHTLGDANFGGPFFMIVGLLILTAAGWVASQAVGLRKPGSFALMTAIGAVSFYYQLLFTYDSTRIAYPIAALLGAAGAYLIATHRRPLGVVALSVAPAFYTSGIFIGLALITFVILRDIGESRFRHVALDTAKKACCFVAAMVIYVVVFRLVIQFAAVAESVRTEPLTVASLQRFVTAYNNYSNPINRAYWVPYYSWSARVLECAALIGFFIFSLATLRADGHRAVRGVALAFMLAFLLAVPTLVTLLSIWTPMRALVTFSIITAGFVAIPYDRLDGYPARLFLFLGGAIVLVAATQISKASFDDNLAYQSDIAMAGRIIARIDALDWPTEPESIPVVVVARGTPPVLAGRGKVASGLWASWSRERALRLLDKRFTIVPPDKRRQIADAASGRPGFPANESVYVQDGVVVVVLNGD